jgi:UvrD/REP helicase N-terminal domain
MMCTSMESRKHAIITSVNNEDVLSGRGGKTNKHMGNRIYRAMVKENRQRYQQMKSNSHKQLLAESIIATVHKRGGRFLKQHGNDQNAWTELSKDEAMIKTTQALREIPSGTSSRALNVERMLEQKRKQRSVSSSNRSQSSSSSESEDRKQSVASISNLSVAAPTPGSSAPSSRRGSVIVSNDGALQSAGDENNEIMSDEELESIVNDSDAFETIVSLLDK